MISQPLYKVTRSKYEFEWGGKETQAFEQTKMAILIALDLWPIQDGPIELHVTASDQLEPMANWSLWQMQSRKRVPLGFWSRKLPEARQSYTPFEQQLLAAYWALTGTEELTIGHDVLLRPSIPIMTCIKCPSVP